MTRAVGRSLVAKTVVLAFLSVAAMPGTANAGFFEDLFSGGRQAPSEVPQYANPASMTPDVFAPREIQRKRKVVDSDKPVLQKTTDLWHDKTLRDGDAVMMKDGLHVYEGSEGSRHNAAEFTRLDATRDISPKARLALVAMDTTRNDPLKSGAAPDTIASGRSAAVASPIVVGYKITDARGQSVRYVGP